MQEEREANEPLGLRHLDTGERKQALHKDVTAKTFGKTADTKVSGWSGERREKSRKRRQGGVASPATFRVRR